MPWTSQRSRSSSPRIGARTARHRIGTVALHRPAYAGLLRRGRRDTRPTTRQIYALAGALCERAGEEFPEDKEAASELIERLRIENGHPAPRLEDVPYRQRRRLRSRQF
jgi:hypothetical protein